MAGIYVHIPFCKQACHYCNFHFSTQQKNIPAIVAAISSEIDLRRAYLQKPVTSIYFGGGTPSLLLALHINDLLNKLKEVFNVEKYAEITLEANPDDITKDQLLVWKSMGINRLSIGVQSFDEADLQWMNRAHNANHALNCLQEAVKHFDNITIDLIYGTPTLSDEQWLINIETALQLGIKHISCYALTVEPKTALEKLIEKRQLENVDTDKQARHFDMLVARLEQAGFEHYEISNFAKPGFRSKHNSSYWQGKHYLGLGPSAHSFNGTSRQWNVANNALYQKSIEQGIIPFEIEQLTPTQQLNEYIMTSLRTIEGLSLESVYLKFGAVAQHQLLKQAKRWIQSEHMLQQKDNLILTSKGKFMADGIAADLFSEHV
jgi:oxygen-independent coproporphyrinogen-3 oxidase